MFFHLSVTRAKYNHKPSRWYNTSICITMSDKTPSDYPRNSSSKRGPKEKPLDPNDPNDSAFVLVSLMMLFLVDFLWIFFHSPLSSSHSITLDAATRLSPPPPATRSSFYSLLRFVALSYITNNRRHHCTPQEYCRHHHTL